MWARRKYLVGIVKKLAKTNSAIQFLQIMVTGPRERVHTQRALVLMPMDMGPMPKVLAMDLM